MAQEQEIVVQRAKASDAAQLAEFINRALQEEGGSNVDKEAIIARLGDVGILLARRDNDLLGFLGWQAENLVARIPDLLIWPASERMAVGRALLSEMEQAALELQCEAALLLLPYPSSPELIEFCEAFGYEPRAVDNLPQAWQEAAHEAGRGEDDTILAKQLRAEQVTRPL